MGPDSKTLPVPEGLPNAHMRLFGGAQYHRAMAEFRASIGELTCPDIRFTSFCGCMHLASLTWLAIHMRALTFLLFDLYCTSIFLI